MPRRKKIPVQPKNLLLETINEKLYYILLGIAIFIFAAILAISFFHKTSLRKPLPFSKITITAQLTPTVIPKPSTNGTRFYRVVDGDSLWKIAQKMYGSGYNAYDIAQANHLPDPNLIAVNQRLTIPSVKPLFPTQGEITNTAVHVTKPAVASYIVQKDDSLWNIAARLYNDGYQWQRIALANNIVNPDIIYSGTRLTIPR